MFSQVVTFMPRVYAKQAIRRAAAGPKTHAKTTSKSLPSFLDKHSRNQGPHFRLLFNQPVSSSAGFIIIAATSALLSFVIIFFTNAPPPLATNVVPSIFSGTRLYVSPTYGYHLRYPDTWAYEIRPVGEFEEVIFSGNGDKIVVATTDNVSIHTLIPAVPENAALNGISALRYHDYDPLTGQPLDRVVAKREEDGQYYEISGYGPKFERLIRSFALLPQ